MEDRPVLAHRVYPAAERPEVVVEVDGEFFDGDLYSWIRYPDGWWAGVRWSSGGGTRTGTFPAAKVHRLDYCPWFRVESQCLHGCRRGGSGDEGHDDGDAPEDMVTDQYTDK